MLVEGTPPPVNRYGLFKKRGPTIHAVHDLRLGYNRCPMFGTTSDELIWFNTYSFVLFARRGFEFAFY